jgi:hypothetical protein
MDTAGPLSSSLLLATATAFVQPHATRRSTRSRKMHLSFGMSFKSSPVRRICSQVADSTPTTPLVGKKSMTTAVGLVMVDRPPSKQRKQGSLGDVPVAKATMVPPRNKVKLIKRSISIFWHNEMVLLCWVTKQAILFPTFFEKCSKL